MLTSKIDLFDLQLFANANVQTTTTSSTGNDLSPEMKTFYSKDLIEMAKAKLVHQQFADKKPIPKGGGKTIEWRKWSSFKKALKPLTEGVTPDGTPVNVGYITATISEYGDYTTVSDMLELTSIDDVITEVTAKHADNMGLTLDTITRNELHTGTQVLYAPTWSGTTPTVVNNRHALDNTAVLTPDLIARAVTVLKKNNAPKIDGCYVGIVHPSVSYDLMTNDDWIDVHKYAAPENVFNGEIGKLYGVRFVETTEAAIYYGANLKSDTVRNLTVASLSTKTVTIDEALDTTQAAALVGREVLIDGIHYTITAAASGAAGSATFTVDDVPAANYPVDGDLVVPGEGGKLYDTSKTYAAYGCLFLGKGAYCTTEIEGAGSEVIVKAKGSAGTSDPLNQRSTIGWKCPAFTAKIVIPEYIVRVECGSSFSTVDVAN